MYIHCICRYLRQSFYSYYVKHCVVIDHFMENSLCTIKIAQTIKKLFKHANHNVYYLKQIFT